MQHAVTAQTVQLAGVELAFRLHNCVDLLVNIIKISIKSRQFFSYILLIENKD